MASEQELQQKFEEARDAHEADPTPENRDAMLAAQDEFAQARTVRKALESVDPKHGRATGAHNVEAEGDH